MILEAGLLIAIAEIAGIFVGFGALIGATRRNEIELFQLSRIRGVVIVGLMVIAVALIPVVLDLYGFTGHNIWFLSSLVFFILNLAAIILSLRGSESRELWTSHTRATPISTVFFWLALEVPLQATLILTMLGWYPNLEPAFYVTALLFSLFQAAFVLTQIVYSQEDKHVPTETAA